MARSITFIQNFVWPTIERVHIRQAPPQLKGSYTKETCETFTKPTYWKEVLRYLSCLHAVS